MGTRAQNKAETRQTLEQVALRLFAERGFSGVTVDDIAAAAGVSRRTYFRYFDTKEAVVFAQHNDRVERFERLLADRRGDEDRMETVRRACLGMAHYIQEHRTEWFAQQTVIVTSRTLISYDIAVEIRWENAIAATLGDVNGASEDVRRRARLLSGATLGMIRAILRDWFDDNGQSDLVAAGRRAFRVVTLKEST